MADHDDAQHFDGGDAGAAETFPMAAGSIKKNAFVMLKDKPCKVVEISTSKTGKHGHAKAHIVGLDIFTNKKYEDICPTSHNMNVPVVKRTEYQLIDIAEDNYVTLLGESGNMESSFSLPKDTDGNLDDQAKKIAELHAAGASILVTVQSACRIDKIVSHKVMEAAN